MTASKWIVSAAMSAVLLGLGLAGSANEPSARLAHPTKVALDFRDRPVGEVVKAVETRTGKKVVAFGRMITKSAPGQFPIGGPVDQGWRDRSVTLESPAPVPFWEAIDRLAVAGQLTYRVGDFGDSTGVVFEGDGEAPSPACYAGPFRIGLLAVHEHRDVVLVRGPWVRFSISEIPSPADAAELASAPNNGGPLYAELNLAAEPGLVCRRDGRMRDLVAVDEAGRSLLDPRKEDARQSVQAIAPLGGGITPIVRVPLRRVEGGAASKVIKTLRGVIPLEVGALKSKPGVVITLGNNEGKTFRGGDAIFTVGTDRTEPDGRIKFAVSCRLSAEEPPDVRDARLAALRTYQIRIVDAQGANVRFASTSSGGDVQGNLTFSYEYAPIPDQQAGPPTEFRYYDLDRAVCLAAFEFHDIPLP
jgi:hypothetical protein